MKATEATLNKLLVLFATIAVISAILLFTSCVTQSSVPLNRNVPANVKPCIAGAKSFAKDVRIR